MPVGWSRDCSLKAHQTYWLDPKRKELEGQEDFKRQYEQGEWLISLERDFAKWIENALEQKFTNNKEEFSEIEFKEWCREFSGAVKASQRKKEGIF